MKYKYSFIETYGTKFADDVDHIVSSIAKAAISCAAQVSLPCGIQAKQVTEF